MKAAKGSGAISGFLVINPDAGNTRPWQEIAFEFFGKSSGGKDYQTQIIVPGPQEHDIGSLPRSQNMVAETSDTSFFDNFHTVRMEWTPSRLSFFYDGKKIREETDTTKYSQFFDPSKTESANIRATLWGGFSDWSGQVDASNPPTSVTIDYISYEKYDQASGSFVPGWKDNFDTFDSARWQKADWTFPFAVNDFSPSNVNTVDGNLVINWSR
jgi:endo-1,3-1,4-beta-glycanase ExoK